MKKLLALLLIFSFILPCCAVLDVNAANVPFTALGTVVDRHGNPVSDATVTLINDNWQTLGTTTTDENGNFGFTNVVSNSNLIKVKITKNEGGKTFQTQLQDTLWVDASQGIVKFDLRDTTLYSYPPPEYGFLWGILQTDQASPRPLGNGVIYVVTNEQKYYAFTSNGAGQGKGTFIMHVPIGHYKVYGQYLDNGMIFQSKIYDVDIYGATMYTESNPLTVSMSVSTPAASPEPAEIPGSYTNKVSGNVTFRDGSPVPDATVSLWQAADNGVGAYSKKAEVRADGQGKYVFNDVKVTSDPPDNSEVFGTKRFFVSSTFIDSQGTLHSENKTFQLYHPNVILGIGNMEQTARNVTGPISDITIPYSKLGWVSIKSNVQGAKVFVDNKPTQYTTPCIAYIEPGIHKIKISASGYADKVIDASMVENHETQEIIAVLQETLVVPPWVQMAAVVLILIVAAVAIVWLLASRRHMLAGPLAAVTAPLKRSLGNIRASREARKAHKAMAADQKTAEQARIAQVREPKIASQPKLDGRKRAEALTSTAEQPKLPGHVEEESPSMVLAQDIYRKKERPDVERVSQSQATGSAASRGSPAQGAMPAPETSGRIRVPRVPLAAKDQPVNIVKDMERVVKYVRDHPDGVSFIQMSNELEIPPNTLTLITKELVINDDVEKVKGLYYYKTRDSSLDERKSSVVVWRLDGDE